MHPKDEAFRLFSDTKPDAERLLINLLSQKCPAEKLRMVDRLNASLRTLTLSGLRKRHPEADEIELQLKLSELLLGAETANKISTILKSYIRNERRSK